MNPITFEHLIQIALDLYENRDDKETVKRDDFPYDYPEISDSERPIWNPNAEVDPSVIDRIRKQGVDSVLAVYRPVSQHGEKRWGIHYHMRNIQSYINEVFRIVASIYPSATYSVVADLVFESIRRHEYEHFVQEMVYLTGTIGNSSPRDYAVLINDSALNLEAMAKQVEILDPWSSKGDPMTRRAVSIALSEFVQSGQYALWRGLDSDSTENHYEQHVSNWHRDHSIKKNRSRTKKQLKNSVVPEKKQK
jgi:hypothetical protein